MAVCAGGFAQKGVASLPFFERVWAGCLDFTGLPAFFSNYGHVILLPYFRPRLPEASGFFALF